MAKLYFYYSSMNAGKSTVLLQSSYNYREKGMQTKLFTPAIDTRFTQGVIHSRIGLSESATIFHPGDNLFQMVKQDNVEYACILIDESQFLTRKQVLQLGDICDHLSIPVLAYGIRTDFQGELFPGSQYLLAWADELIEIKTICHCGRKATMILRLNEQGQVVSDGSQVLIGGNNLYVSTCRKHFNQKQAFSPTKEFCL
jgi:thymidine kinase